ncbi:MAG TPA: BrnT family toxin [Caulobacteraceae bacterium]|nr:BrnT family toxin [Caulobacteraceae bacterium]
MAGDTRTFEWDSAKASAARRHHGVTFELATLVFDDPGALGWVDNDLRYGEERFVIIGRAGMAADALLTVVYTQRRERIRIISARRATRREREDYDRGQAAR